MGLGWGSGFAGEGGNGEGGGGCALKWKRGWVRWGAHERGRGGVFMGARGVGTG